jgi:hypothetical protein
VKTRRWEDTEREVQFSSLWVPVSDFFGEVADFHAVDLERSTSQDHVTNSFGLTHDTIGLILSFLSIQVTSFTFFFFFFFFCSS